MRRLMKKLQEKFEGTMSAVAFAEEGEVKTARELLSQPPTEELTDDDEAPAAHPRPVVPIGLGRPERA